MSNKARRKNSRRGTKKMREFQGCSTREIQFLEYAPNFESLLDLARCEFGYENVRLVNGSVIVRHNPKSGAVDWRAY